MAAERRRYLLRGARQLVTLQGPTGPRRGTEMRNLGIIPDGALLIEDGIIVQVGPSRRVENLAEARDAVEISADGRVVLPGFVDAHAHPVCGPPLLAAYEMRLAGASEDEVAASAYRESLRKWFLSASRQRMEYTARRVLREFVRHGTTTLEGRGGLAAEPATEVKLLKALAAIQNRPLEIVPVFSTGYLPAGEAAEPYLEKLASQVLNQIQRKSLARMVDLCCGPGALTVELARPLAQRARELGFDLKFTMLPGALGDVVELALESGARSIDGLEIAGAELAARLAASPTVLTLLPGACFHRMSGTYPPARALIDCGVAVALATGFSMHLCPTCSIPAIVALACHEMRMMPAEAITAATINAACALGVADRVGSLQSGKQADLIMLNVPDYREIPYHFGMNLVAMVMKRGQILYPRLEAS